MDVGQPHHGERREHEDADARAEVAAVDADEELKHHHADDRRAVRRLVRLADAERLGDHRLQREQRRRDEDEPRHERAKICSGSCVTSSVPGDAADEARRHELAPPSASRRETRLRKPQSAASDAGNSATVLVPLASTLAASSLPGASRLSTAISAGKREQRAAAGDGIDAAAERRRQTKNASSSSHGSVGRRRLLTLCVELR